MSFSEAPSVQEISRKLTFSSINWLTREKFLEFINLNQSIYPYLIEDGKKCFIGKTIQNNLKEGVRFGRDFYSGNNIINLEIIGTVSENENNEWILNVPHSCTVHTVKDQFLILSIEDKNSFEWISTQDDQIPKYALRGCIDRFTNEYFYIGKPSFDLNRELRVDYYDYVNWNRFREPIPNYFGKVHVSHKCLYLPFDKLELRLNKYDILCLKPSPASLKILSRTKLRELLKNSNENISRINKNKSGRKYVPEMLVNFIKFPSSLSVGEYMMKGEKLVRDDDKFELVIEENGKLICKSLIKDKKSLSTEELTELEDTQVARIISYNVDSIWLHRFQVAFYEKSKRVHVVHNFFGESPEYLFKISDHSDTPSYTIVQVE